MSFEVINAEESAVRTIRSYLRTLMRYRNTSMAIHNRCVVGVQVLASDFWNEVIFIGDDLPNSPAVQQWVSKFREYMHATDLLPDVKGEKDVKQEKPSGSTILPNAGQDRPNKAT